MPSAATTPSVCCSRCGASAPRAAANSSRWAGTRRWPTSPRACEAIAARDPEAIVPYSYAGTMGLVQGEGMAARFFNKLGASRLDRTICSMAGGDALDRHLRRQGRHAHAALRREPADRHLGQQLDRQQPALLEPGATGQARRRPAGVHRPAAHRDGRQMPPAHRAAARHRRCARARRDARADRRRPARPRLHRTPCRRLCRLARARAAMAARARRRGVRHHGRRGARPGPRPGHHPAGGDPPELRHAARARRRQRRPADRAAALPDRRLAPARRRPVAVELGLVRAVQEPGLRARRSAGRAQTQNHQHEHHRRRPAAPVLARLRPADRGPDRLQQQSGGGGARSRRRSPPASPAKTCSPSCSSTS